MITYLAIQDSELYCVTLTEVEVYNVYSTEYGGDDCIPYLQYLGILKFACRCL